MRQSMRYYRIEASDWHDLGNERGRTDEIRIEPREVAYMAHPHGSPFDEMTFAIFSEKYDLADTISALNPNTTF